MTTSGPATALPVSFGRTVVRILQQSWPVLVGQWAVIAFGVLDTIMTGHASPRALASMALSASIYTTVFVGLIGVLHALIPIVAQHFGAGRLAQIGHAWGQGVWLALGLSGVGAAALLLPDVWLSLSGEVDPAVRTDVAGYLRMLALALPASLVFRTVYALNTAVSRPKVVMLINLAGVGFKALFNWLLIYGKFGLPALGAVGAGLSTALVFWISASIGLLILARDRFYAPFGLRLGRPDGTALRELLRLGLPMGASYLVEVTSFTFMALLAAREGIYATGAHQIMANLIAVCFMTPLALGIASAALTAQAIGAGDLAQARRTGSAGLALGAAGAVLAIVLILVARPALVRGYTSDASVALVALSLLNMLAFFHLADALQCIAGYLLRAYKIAVAPLLIQAGALWGIGLLGGWWLGFGPAAGSLAGPLARIAPGAPTGVATLWAMASAGTAISALLLLLYYRRATRRAPPAARREGSVRGST